ncbi:lantibiotic immunity ABC transporter MutG family permease subunit [Paraclostridium sordellii]|uniref:lantibiotic immunity ABC transporter MutG family permease subunit n=1 Tax=Paraclostridium sordellii TaxID=1505 RepID=UPI0005DE252B|nr:lantibiotic immunity ABC transporter MutG family permease subunit [Paeniclostridium sordellii]CEN24563.1 putative lantibiotic ABC transporter permease [[Clostridium] sordellii] [Paeniclostridium sordellii]
MVHFLNYLKADFYKFYHSNIIKLHLIIPIITVISFLLYYTISPWSELEKVMAYVQIISISFPLIISIIVNMVYEQEEEAGFQYFLGIADKKYFAHFSKLILMLILGLISTLIAILGFGITFHFMGNSLIEIGVYIKESLIVFGSSILLYMLQYLVVFYFGRGASIGIGIIGSTISALMITGIGEGVWTLLPWGYSIRLSSYFLLYNLDILNKKEPITQAIIMMIVFIAIFLVLQLTLSNRWEGKIENY